MDCYVLVGGRSRRMGAAKASIPFAGSTFFGRVAAAAEEAFDAVIAVQRGGEAAIELARPRVTTIFERAHEDEAPLFGVARAVEDAEVRGNERLFVVALDYPLLDGALLGDLRRRFESSAGPMLVPAWRGIPQVLCAGYSVCLREMIEAQLTSRRYDLRSLLPQAELVPLDSDALMNVNTPEELEEAKAVYERQRLLSSG